MDVFSGLRWGRGARGEDGRHAWIVAAIVVLALLGIGWWVTILAGGSDKVTLNWFYIPILAAAIFLGPWGTLVAAILATLIAGPLTPADARLHQWEPPSVWLVRGAFYVGIGMFTAWVIRLRKRTEQQLEATKAAYRSLVEQLPGVVYMCEFGGDGDWLYVSPGIKDLLGYTPDEWLAHPHPFRSHVHPGDYLWVLQQEILSRSAGVRFDIEYRMRRRDGTWIRVRDTASVVRAADGTPMWLQGVLTDVTADAQAQPQTRGAA